MTIAITGATGFIGRQLVKTALERAVPVRPIYRRGSAAPPGSSVIADIMSPRDWAQAFHGTDTAVHLMALAHDRFPADQIDAVNHLAARAAAEGALIAGVSRFIFLSTAHVYGAASTEKIIADDEPRNPQSAYAAAKCKAEDAIMNQDAAFAEGVLILRPPLVYGPQPKGNILRMIQAIKLGVPLPVASWTHRRTMVSVRNLCNAILAASAAPLRAKSFIVCDDKSLTLSQTAIALGAGLGRAPRLFSCPVFPLRALSGLPRIGGLLDKLTGPLVYDGGGFRNALGWRPAQCPEEGLRDAGASMVE
jgi:nucleoside-diphosphate-sugar epimerase